MSRATPSRPAETPRRHSYGNSQRSWGSVSHPRREEMPDNYRRQHADNCSGNHIGEMVRVQIQSRCRDQQRDRQQSQPDSPPRQKQRPKESGRGRGVAGRKCVILRRKTKAVPSRVRFDQRSRPASSDLNSAVGRASHCACNDHSREDHDPATIPPRVGDPGSNESDGHVLRPIAPPADTAHERSHGRHLMLRHPPFDKGIAEEGCAEKQSAHENQKEPAAHATRHCHREKSRLCFKGRYLSVRLCNLQSAISRSSLSAACSFTLPGHGHCR